MTSDREAIVRAVIAEPDEDTHRLAFADWCEEHREGERAEFVRVQLDLAAEEREYESRARQNPHLAGRPRRCPETISHLESARPTPTGWEGTAVVKPCECRRCGLVRRERALCARHMNRFAGHDFPLFGLGGWQWAWRRGFIEALALSAADWLRHADAVLAEHPVREVTLTTWPGYYYRLESERLDLWVIPPEWTKEGDGESCLFSERPARVRIHLEARWPAVTVWHLPPATNPVVAAGIGRWRENERQVAAAIQEGMTRATQLLAAGQIDYATAIRQIDQLRRTHQELTALTTSPFAP